ncbi:MULTISPECIES: helix-turn-helix domain-containing protein [unclassified Cryobacterium]|uniref:helix-turn-helix domain-containing protein n=1 Tax=unclassified Cryobacterium TaxID=2649013 RepID=UPI00106C37F0|nr:MULTISPECIES: helix-turn-helix domain-containing protein [unclassified Cryobacterium]TFB96565.1 XRE family transcriptional regulator [Cryobacterium sp. MDB2-A-1]TFC12849.1 XRE family transcriptional regulator [Cryobacterium sp. MDB2-A-2]
MGINTDRRSRITSELRAEIARQAVPTVAVAKAAGITVKTLRRRLDGGKAFNLDELAAVCSFLNVPLVEFISRTDVAA